MGILLNYYWNYLILWFWKISSRQLSSLCILF